MLFRVSRSDEKSGVVFLLAVVLFIAGAGFVAWSALGRQKDAYLTRDLGASFDLREIPENAIPPRPAPLPPASPSPPDLTAKPVPLEGAFAPSGRSRAGAAARGRAPRPIGAAGERWARAQKAFADFLRAPARRLARRSSALSSPGALRSFLASSRGVDAYLNSPLVRVTLNSPSITKSLLSDPGVVRAVLESPAMRDPAAVKALLHSRMLKKMLDCPGPQSALEDPGTVTSLMSNPAVGSWLATNPGAFEAVAEAAPSLAGAYAPRRRGG